MDAFEAEGIDYRVYLKEFPIYTGYDHRTAPMVPLPWDHLDTLVEKRFQAVEMRKALKGRLSPPCMLPVQIVGNIAAEHGCLRLRAPGPGKRPR